MTIKGILIDIEKETVKAVTVENNLDKYLEILNCDYIDITTRRIANKQFCIICDDEGLFNKSAKISAVNRHGKPVLVGNLFVVKYNGIDDVESLNDNECNHILNNIEYMITSSYQLGYPILRIDD